MLILAGHGNTGTVLPYPLASAWERHSANNAAFNNFFPSESDAGSMKRRHSQSLHSQRTGVLQYALVTGR